MKAVRIHEYGDVSVLRYENAPMPAMVADEVLVRVHAAAVNPADWQFRYGYYKEFAPRTMPLTLGWDVAGTVDQVGAGAGPWSKGDRVFAMADMARNGAYAEFIAIRGAHLACAPKTVPLEHAAGVPLAALTAWKALFDLGALLQGQRVLVHAAAGGVGLFAVQLAHYTGARVLATAASAGNAERLRALGADEVIDYRNVDFRTVVRDVDLVIDNVGGETREKSWEVIRKGGRLVAVAMPPPDGAVAAANGVQSSLVAVVPDGERLARIGELIDAGKLRVLIDREYPLEEIAAAHTRSEGRHACGKIILRVSA
jgi:NADPH:quinone reductase-like Zn-dependent oxidoreductase